MAFLVYLLLKKQKILYFQSPSEFIYIYIYIYEDKTCLLSNQHLFSRFSDKFYSLQHFFRIFQSYSSIIILFLINLLSYRIFMKLGHFIVFFGDIISYTNFLFIIYLNHENNAFKLLSALFLPGRKPLPRSIFLFLQFLFFFPTGSCSNWYPAPKFVATESNVTVIEGEHAFLPCRVANLGDRSVSVIIFRNDLI